MPILSFDKLVKVFKQACAGQQPTILYEYGSICSGNKICLFAHFDPNDEIDDYVLYYLTALKSYGFNIVFVSTSEKLNQSSIDSIKNVVSKIVVRNNVGYDFYSWKTGYTFADLSDCDLLLLANDSVLGPIFTIDNMFEHMHKTSYDIWGVTDNYQISYHIQSYFICFSIRPIRDGYINTYMDCIKIKSSKQDIINKYEIGLIKTAITKGYKIGAFCRYDELEKHEAHNKLCNNKVNQTLCFAYDILDKFKVPFVKKELLLKNPCSVNLSQITDFINNNTVYPICYIDKYSVNSK